MVQWAYETEEHILLFVQNHMRNAILTPCMKAVSLLGDMGAVWILLSIGLLLWKKWRKTGEMGICAVALSVLVNNLFLKHFVARSRPFTVIEALVPLIKKPTDYSFPSGHTACAFAVGFLLFRRLPKPYGILCLILAALIGFSRIYLGVHYPSDVIAGMASGICISYAAEWIVEHLPHVSLHRKEKQA